MTFEIPLALFDSPIFNSVILIIGTITLFLLILWFIFILVMGILVVISIRRKKMYFPRILRPFLSFAENGVRIICSILGIEAVELLNFMISIDNKMNLHAFEMTPVSERVVFFPQCLRSAECPARLTPDGIRCLSCGKCGLGATISVLEKAGYRVFIIPGSTFIKRMVKKYSPKAMIGVGCLTEVKDGLEMGRRISMTTLGVVTLRDGCVETTMDYDALLETASIGLDHQLVREK
ncbi:MAG TPA: DUF116 domain-containing protein [Methanocorpusculum sp.]|nr:DUF116 domain-containing protein [Methanocorpusculum sp.]